MSGVPDYMHVLPYLAYSVTTTERNQNDLADDNYLTFTDQKTQ